ncbi:hypothetical protein ACF1GW_39085 [Streptomyces achromogenes]|uniref:hypothetical protein n=1 Tax=Streptomyces achromogenes TaxID=67255 RepID=UPI0036F75193
MTAQGGELQPAEYLYGIDSSVSDDARFYQGPRVVEFRITKKTAKRIYYVVSADWEPRTRIGFVDRQRIEADGEIYLRNRHWSAPDFHLYLNRPEIPEQLKPDLASLRAEMAAAHPDRGGSDEAFIAARARYERARASQQGQTPPTEGDQVT